MHTANVEKAHENGLKVVVWTINTLRKLRSTLKKGVDGITSDKPDILNKAKRLMHKIGRLQNPLNLLRFHAALVVQRRQLYFSG